MAPGAPESSSPRGERGPVPDWLVRLGVLAWFVGLVVVATWPTVLDPSARIIGDEYSGAWRTLWAHDWTLRRLVTDGAWPLTAPEVNFPRGGPFSSIAPVNDLLSLLPQLVFGLVPAYNLVVAFHMLLAATGAYMVGRVAGLGRPASVVAGTVFGLNSFLLSYGVASAVVETSTVGWVAWFVAAMLALVKNPRLSTAVATGVLFAIAGVSSFYWAAIIAVLAPLLAVPALFDAFRRPGQRRGRLIGYVVLSLVVAGLAFGPPTAALLSTYTTQDALLQDYAARKQELLSPSVMSGLAHDFGTVAGFLLPGKGSAAVHSDMDRLVQTTYVGWVALVLASFGLGRGRRRWLVVGLTSAVLALGPFAFVTLDSWRHDPTPWWVALRELLPPLKMITSYVRFTVFFHLALGVLAGFGVEALVARLGRRTPVWMGVGAGIAASIGVVVETATVSPAPFPVPTADARIPDANRALAEMPRAGAVLDWPQRYPGMRVEVSRYFYYQSVHHRPIPYDFAPTSYMPGAIEGNPFFARLERLAYGDDYDSGAWSVLTQMPESRGLQDLGDMGFAYLVLHPEHIDPDRLSLVVGWLAGNLELVATYDDGTAIYEIPSDLGRGSKSLNW